MFVVGQRVDGRNLGILGEFLDVVLGVGADDGAMNHSAQHPGGVFDWFPTTELAVVGIEEDGIATQFADANLEADTRSGGGLAEDERPGFSRERAYMVVPVRFHSGHQIQNGSHVPCGQMLQA